MDDSISTPGKPAPIKVSQIKDKPAKLKAYIEQKRTNKLKEQIEQRSPFIPYVPVGRWVERKEPVRKPKAFTISTPVRKALMSDGKILKKSTIKEIATTAKKENIGASKKTKNVPVQSKKNILTEVNAVLQTKPVEEPVKVSPQEKSPELNETFELIRFSSDDDIKTPEKPILESLRAVNKEELLEGFKILSPDNAQKAVPEKLPKDNSNVRKEPVKTTDKKVEVKKAKIVVPVKRPVREKTVQKKQIEKEVPKKANEKRRPVTKSKSAPQKSIKSPVLDEQQVEVSQKVVPQNVVQVKEKSHLYKFYKSSVDNQERYISIQLKGFTSNLDNFIEKLPEEMQSTVHQTIQQGKLLVNEKFQSFEEILDKYENANESDPKRITDDDLENYWMLLYEQIDKFKENLQLAQEAKTIAMKGDKKRRTRRTLSETPSRRSRRIAECGDTPK